MKSVVKSANQIDWPITLFLLLAPIAALILTPLYIAIQGITWPLVIFSLIFAILTNLSITAGYHRLFAHKSYEAHWVLRLLYLLVGASAFQGSAFKWSSDHRRHHSFEDTDKDPYSINKGFWFAHMGWLFIKTFESENPKAPDLDKDWMVKFQHRYYVPVALLMGFGFPTLVGALLGTPWGGFVIAGALRIVLTQQTTFFINSICHTFGRRPFTKDVTARDSFWIALLTHGEGYHNFHHKFQIDYRNGIQWYDWDPTKWTIFTLSTVGLAKKLKKASQQEILKARLQVEELKLRSRGISESQVALMKQKIIDAQARLKKLREDYNAFKKNLEGASKQKLEEIKWEIELAKLEFRMSLKMWSLLLNKVPS